MNEVNSILVVDDDDSVRDLFSRVLQMEKYQVWEATSGRRGLELAREIRPDLVLLDVHLPDLSGVDVCRQIKTDPALEDVLVVLCSGEATSMEQKIDGLQTGADDYLFKPLGYQELAVRIRTLMRLRNTVAALRKSEEYNRRLVDILPDAVCLINPEGKLLAVNAQAVTMFGYASPEELLTKSALELTAESDRARIGTDLANILKTGLIRNAEYTLLKKNQTPFQIELSATLSLTSIGQPGLVSVMRDVTERRQAEQKIYELLGMVDQAHDAIIVRDLAGHIQYFNKGAERILGWSAAEVRGRADPEIFFKEPTAFAAAVETLQATGEWNGETQALTKARQPVIFESRWTLVRQYEGQLSHILTINTDVTRRKLTEVLLKQQEELSQQVIGAALDGFWRIDLQENLLDVNDAYCRMTGYSRAELLAMRVSDLEVNEPQPELVGGHIRTILNSGGDRFESRHRCKDGRTIEVEITATALKSQANYIFAFVRDISGHKLAEKILRASEERFRQLADNIHEVFWITDVVTEKMIYISPAFNEIWGRSCESIYASANNWYETIHPADREKVLKSCLARQVNGDFLEVYRILRPDGSTRWIQDRAFPVRDGSGAVYRIIGIAEDITKRKLAWDALGESEARKSAIMRVALDGIVTVDHEGKILELNLAAEKIFNQTREKLIGHEIIKIIPVAFRAWFQAGLANCFTGKRGPAIGSRIEMPALRGDGNHFPAEFTITRIRIEGHPTFAVYIRDITQRKRFEEELRLWPQRIIEAQESERQRVARELHDGINQIIASVKMRVCKVADNLTGINPAAREILVRCDRLLVKALEENRRISHNLHPSDLKNLGLSAACRQLTKEFELRANLKVDCRIAAQLSRLDPGVELNLFRIVQEAINNIEKHAQATHVHLQIGLKANDLVLTIQDDGCGFDPGRPKAKKKKGHGLGLTNLRERARALGGTCEVVSAPKKGTTIKVIVPRKKTRKAAGEMAHTVPVSTQQTA